MKTIRAFDTIGNIVLVRFPKEFKRNDKKKFALKLLKEQKSVKTVLEKVGKVKGRLRKLNTRFIAGEKTREVLYKENDCIFRFNINETYFSSRLSNERKEIAKKIKKRENVLVMFSGVCPFGVVIAKISKAKKIVCVEINRKANKYAKLNVELNKVKDKVEIVQGDIKKIIFKLKEKFDVIVMPRPQLKESFLKEAFKLSKRRTRIFYYDFCGVDETDLIIKKIKEEARKFGKRVKIVEMKKAGEIAPYRVRVRVEFLILY